MKRATFITIILLLVGLITTACGGFGPGGESEEATENGAETAQEGASTELEENFVSVEVAEVEEGDIAQFFDYAGDLQPQKEIDVVPEIGGKVETLLIEVGDTVTQGDTIATLNQDTLLVELQQAEAAVKGAVAGLKRLEAGSRAEEIAAAQALVQSARAQLNEVITIDDDERTRAATTLATTRAELKRAQQAYDKIAWASDIGTRQESVDLERATVAYETALAQYNLDVTPRDSSVAPLMENLARAELSLELALNPYRDFDFEAAQAAIEQAEAGVKQVQLRLEKTNITAPFSGIVADVFIEEGSIINTQAPISHLISNEIEAQINAEETRIGLLSVGQSATLNVQAYPGVDFPAVVTSIDPTGDSNSRTFPVTIVPIDEEGLLKSGMYADLSILSEERQGVPLVPQAAIVTIDNQPSVYVVLDENVVEQRQVTIGLSNNVQAEILEGLQPGDVVVIAGQPNLADGVKVEIVSGF